MDLLHTGSDELVYIRTDKVSVTIKGKASHPNFQGVEYSDHDSTFKVFCDDDFELDLKGISAGGTLSTSSTYSGVYTVPPLFYEQQRYELIIEAEGNHSIHFWHDNLNIRNKITQAGRSGKILSGMINFGNEIGLSDLVIQVDGENYLRLVIEVFPSKISYQEDYQEIMKDIANEVSSLVFDFLKKVHLSLKLKDQTCNTLVEFFAILEKIYADYLKAVDLILSQPHHILEKTHEVLPAHKIKRVDSQGRRWIEKHPDHAMKSGGRIAIDRALAVKKQVTYDTRENQLTKYILRSTVKKLATFKRNYLKLQRPEDHVITDRIDQMIRDLNRRSSVSFLSDVGEYTASSSMSLVFSMAPGYRELYKYYLMLLHGLSITGDIFNISSKDMALLYEYWCFIKLNSLMKENYQLVSQDMIKVQGNGLYVSLVKGSGSKVKYRNPENGETITLSYNPRITELPTGTQRPDNVLRLEKKGASTDYEYVFDAKYRINPALQGTDYYNFISRHPGPEVDDINTMHRYRDAIVYQKGASAFERTMFGAYVLFPYKDEKQYKSHRFYESIGKVNIGGLPFLPSATSLVKEMLDELIADSPDSAFERATLPRGIEEKLAHVDWTRRDVLVGGLHDRSQLDTSLSHRSYYVPVARIPAERTPIHYIAIYQSKRLFGVQSGVRYYGEVIRCSIVSGVEISDYNEVSDEPFYHFEVKEWKELSRPIAAKEISARYIFTNMFLLEHSEEVPDLNLKSENEYRFYSELKRALHHVQINEQDAETGFMFNNSMIVFERGKINAYRDKRIIASYSVDTFNRKPGAVLRQFQKKLNPPTCIR